MLERRLQLFTMCSIHVRLNIKKYYHTYLLLAMDTVLVHGR